MRTEIRELHQRLGTTSIYVTHDQIEAMTMADNIVVMRAGVVEQSGDPLTLYDRPVNTFVAGFIGSPAMNLLAGTVRGQGADARVAFADGSTLPLPPGARGDHGQPVLYGIRPEHCRLARDGDGGLPVEVLVVEPTGADTQLYCRFDGHRVTATLRERACIKPADRLRLLPDAEHSHLFEATGGRRLAG
jgi:multiple sugar transport system ATP-binding protein